VPEYKENVFRHIFCSEYKCLILKIIRMEHDNYRITGFGAISQEDARELERQQAELLKDELKSLSSSDDKQRISAIEERLKAIQKLAENY